jgi:hypothetical protein
VNKREGRQPQHLGPPEPTGEGLYVFTGTKPYPEDEVAEAYEKWLPTLKRAVSNALGNLIDIYVKSVKQHPSATIQNLPELEADLRKAARVRNALCHGSWRVPDANAASRLFYVERRGHKFESEIDVNWLLQTQAHVAELACEVINTVTHMGWQFPGFTGPGKPVF